MSRPQLAAALLVALLFVPLILPAQGREEPDFAFLAGGPYTQKKGTFQVISATRFDTERGNPEQKFRSTLLRTEFGITDRLELDIILNGEGTGELLEGRTKGFFTRADSLLGVRYRLLDEARHAPFTLSTGPQLVLPTGKRDADTGKGRVGYAWDLAMARDFGGPVFAFFSLNYAATPGFSDPTAGSRRAFLLHSLVGAFSLGLRPLERETAGKRHHDVHIYLEAAGLREEEVIPGEFAGRRTSAHAISFAPGVRYGFLTPSQRLFEIGVSVPLGLNRGAPDYGLILQIQFESFLPGRGTR